LIRLAGVIPDVKAKPGGGHTRSTC
jgi:hypothetical protein